MEINPSDLRHASVLWDAIDGIWSCSFKNQFVTSLTTPAMTDIQTTLVPPGGATAVKFQIQIPGRHILVDHALSRLQRGLAGYLIAEGPEYPDIFTGTATNGSGH